MTELEKGLREEYEKLVGTSIIDYSKRPLNYITFLISKIGIGNIQLKEARAEIERLRSLTRWHEGVPEKDGEYLIELRVASGVALLKDHFKNGVWLSGKKPLRWAYLPKEGE